MSAMTLKDVLDWIESADDVDLGSIASELMSRGLVADPLDVAELEQELAHMENDEQDEGLLEEAAARLRRRDWREALHTLAAALGRDFDALETIPLRSA